MKSVGIFFQKSPQRFFLKIGILSVKVYTKKVPNIEEYNFIYASLSILSTKQVIKGEQLYEPVCKSRMKKKILESNLLNLVQYRVVKVNIYNTVYWLQKSS